MTVLAGRRRGSAGWDAAAGGERASWRRAHDDPADPPRSTESSASGTAGDHPAELRRQRRSAVGSVVGRRSPIPTRSGGCGRRAPRRAACSSGSVPPSPSGVTTDELDAISHDAYIAEGGYPSPLGYRGFPKSICTSVNEVVAHGIPDDRPLADGDIVNCDITIYLDGMHGDCSATFLVGDVDPATRHLVDVTAQCLVVGIDAVRPGGRVRDIGRAIQAVGASRGVRHRERARWSRHRGGVPLDAVRPSLRRTSRSHPVATGHGLHDRTDADPGRPRCGAVG